MLIVQQENQININLSKIDNSMHKGNENIEWNQKNKQNGIKFNQFNWLWHAICIQNTLQILIKIRSQIYICILSRNIMPQFKFVPANFIFTKKNVVFAYIYNLEYEKCGFERKKEKIVRAQKLITLKMSLCLDVNIIICTLSIHAFFQFFKISFFNYL